MSVDVTALGTALVTGATSGIGRAFAHRLAAGGHALVLVARDRDRLDALAESLAAAHGVRVEVLAADLTDQPSRVKVEKRLADLNNPIDLLVNNAGDTISGDIIDTDPDRLRAHLALNVAAVQSLTRSALPGMLARRRGAVVNVSSVNGFVALPGGAAVYGAGKAYITALSESLAAGLRNTGVHVMALCPGLTRTEFAERNPTDTPGLRGRAKSWSSEAVVDSALADLASGRVLSIPGRRFKVTVAAGILVPYRPPSAFLALVRQRRVRFALPPRGRALITGAGSPIGGAFAERLAVAGFDLVLVDREEAALRELADRIGAAHGSTVDVLAANLADPADCAVVERRFAVEGSPVDLVVNSSDHATVTGFVDTHPADLAAELQVNVAAVVDVTRAALPGMLARRRGAIVNVSGVSGYLPGSAAPRSAANAFVTSLSQGLALSLLGTGVHVMALCPDRTGTGPAVTAALADLERRRAVSVPGTVSKVVVGLARVLPRGLVRALVARAASRQGAGKAHRPDRR